MDLSCDDKIEMYLHCGKCIKEIPNGVTPREYTNYEVGWTKQGLQVWCKRHECNVVHIHFEGQKHPANTRIKADKEEKKEPHLKLVKDDGE